MSISIKFTHNIFDYYELAITAKTDIEQVIAKLNSFKHTRANATDVIVLSFSDDCTIEKINLLVEKAGEFARTNDIVLHSIKQSKLICTNNIMNIPVIDFPQVKKSKHIYNKTLMINNPVRSGVKIYNDGDIIINTFVSNGAEIVASGNIHIYGELRGKVLAGSNGNKSAKIFVKDFNPELISIGGIYWVIDTKLPDNLLSKFVVISLTNKDKLNIVAI
ncbi:MAG: septum site-determining protein MinC [Burkholderiales bacterium]|nr:septum site-determining protein MinC [Burkholderiales bacterium]